MNIRQFDDLRYIEAVSQIINYTSHVIGVDQLDQDELEKKLRICIEIYLSKIEKVEQLISVIDNLMSST
jgi:hypothetical protein